MTASINPGAQARAERILFVGAQSIDIPAVLGDHEDEFEVTRSRGTADTIALVISNNFAHVVVDQTAEDPALALLVPLLASSDHDFKLFVVAQAEEAGKYSRIPGVDGVIAAQHATAQLRAALGIKPKPTIAERIEPMYQEAVATAQKVGGSLQVRNRAMAFISNSYKNAAFALLALLFAAFSFYAVLIGFFLIGSSWGAPVTLSSGHELVAKVEQQISDLKINANLVSQRVSEAELEASKAERAMFDADLLVGYIVGTVEQEIENRRAQRATLGMAIKRGRTLKGQFQSSLGDQGLAAKFRDLYAKRVIDRKTMQSNTLGLLEASQRLSGIEGELEFAADQLKALDATIRMLSALKIQLLGAPMEKVEAASADLMLLTKQALDARSALDQAKVQHDSARGRLELLTNSQQLLAQRIAEVEASPLGRAMAARVDVIFVPYGNDTAFTPGQPLYSCSFVIIACRKVGQVGAKLAGESNSVHPFFGKPIRGGFVEAILSDPSAASREIIHGHRAPFYF